MVILVRNRRNNETIHDQREIIHIDEHPTLGLNEKDKYTVRYAIFFGTALSLIAVSRFSSKTLRNGLIFNLTVAPTTAVIGALAGRVNYYFLKRFEISYLKRALIITAYGCMLGAAVITSGIGVRPTSSTKETFLTYLLLMPFFAGIATCLSSIRGETGYVYGAMISGGAIGSTLGLIGGAGLGFSFRLTSLGAWLGCCGGIGGGIGAVIGTLCSQD